MLVLSPRCWPVSPLCYVQEPRRLFPAALSSPLDEFAAFWQHSECGAGVGALGWRCGVTGSGREADAALAGQSRPGWVCARPRRLQWTWLGRAELRFGDCVLHVSTLQMFVLLRFNSAEVGAGPWGRRAVAAAAFWGGSAAPWGGDVPARSLPSIPLQEVAVDALLQATGLPAELVHQALAPLTHGDGILVQSCTQGGECGAGISLGQCWPGSLWCWVGKWEFGM